MSVKQIDKNIFTITYTTYSTGSKWASNPHQSSITPLTYSLPIRFCDNPEVIEWIETHTEGCEVIKQEIDKEYFSFYNEEDAVQFKLTWL